MIEHYEAVLKRITVTVTFNEEPSDKFVPGKQECEWSTEITQGHGDKLFLQADNAIFNTAIELFNREFGHVKNITYKILSVQIDKEY